MQAHAVKEYGVYMRTIACSCLHTAGLQPNNSKNKQLCSCHIAEIRTLWQFAKTFVNNTLQSETTHHEAYRIQVV